MRMARPLHVAFAAGATGAWRIDSITPVTGEPLAAADRLAVIEGAAAPLPAGAWALSGVVSHLRYTEAREAEALAAVQAPLARPQATRAALIPIRKTEAWWALAQDARRALFAGAHMEIGMDYLPAVARRLHHSRDAGGPFDFITWFDYAPADADAFEEMVRRYRATREWSYVDREVDVRLSRAPG